MRNFLKAFWFADELKHLFFVRAFPLGQALVAVRPKLIFNDLGQFW